jgi:hypothetical protein
MKKDNTNDFGEKENRRIVKIWDSIEKINKDKNKQIINSKMIILENISICDFEAMAERLYGY